jgi:hypothetical protein
VTETKSGGKRKYLNEKKARYLELCHAMQTGVAYEMNQNVAPTQPKHLRVGINAAMCDHAGLVELLIQKGIITEEEYLDALICSMEREVAKYEKLLSEQLNANITLG